MKKIELPIAFIIFCMSSICFAHSGGVSGGGGNVFADSDVDRPTTATQAVALIQAAENDLEPYMQNKYVQLQNGALSGREKHIFEKLFKNSEFVFKNIKDNPVYIEIEKACETANKIAADGCIFSPVQNTICISASSIAQKLNSSEIKHQATALMIHEYSELAGFNEEHAVEIQKVVVQDLTK